MEEIVFKALALTGGGIFLYQAYQLLDFCYLHCVRSSALPRYRHSPNGQSSGPWAFVTGASDGIGRGFAEELCNRGFNVILHGRNERKLDGAKAELSSQWPHRQIRTLVNDAQLNDEVAIAKIMQALEGLYITVLVNNVGGLGPVHPLFTTLQERTGKEVDALIDINARFTTQVTRVTLPTLLKNAPSLILNIGSVTAELPAAYVSIYAGTKAYITAWSRSLTAEMAAEGQDVEVLGVTVGEVENQTKKGSNFFKPTARKMAIRALDAVGCGRALVTAFWPHALQLTVLGLLPIWLQQKVLVGVSKEIKEAESKKQ